MFSPSPIIVVHRETRLEGMLNRWGTRGQAKFLLQRAAAVERARQAERAGAPVGRAERSRIGTRHGRRLQRAGRRRRSLPHSPGYLGDAR